MEWSIFVDDLISLGVDGFDVNSECLESYALLSLLSTEATGDQIADKVEGASDSTSRDLRRDATWRRTLTRRRVRWAPSSSAWCARLAWNGSSTPAEGTDAEWGPFPTNTNRVTFSPPVLLPFPQPLSGDAASRAH